MGRYTKPRKKEVALVRSATIAARRLKEAFENQKIYVSNVPLSMIPYMFLRKAGLLEKLNRRREQVQ